MGASQVDGGTKVEKAETFHGSARISGNSALSVSVGQAVGMVLGMLVMLALAATSALAGFTQEQREFLFGGVLLGSIALGAVWGWIDALRWRSAVLYVDEQAIRVEVEGQEGFYARWSDVRLRRRGLFGNFWEAVDTAGRVLPLQRFDGSGDMAQLLRVLRLRVPKRKPMSHKHWVGLAILFGLMVCLGLLVSNWGHWALDTGRVGLSIGLRVVGALLVAPGVVGLTLVFALFAARMQRSALDRELRRFPEVGDWWERAGKLGQARPLSAGIWHRYWVPERLRPGRAVAKRLLDQVMLTQEGNLRVKSGSREFECTGPAKVFGDPLILRMFGSRERWKRGLGEYVIDRRFLEPVSEAGNGSRDVGERFMLQAGGIR